MTGTEHFFQGENNSFANELFFEEGLTVYEMYNALVEADKAAPQLGLGESIKHIQSHYPAQISNNVSYLAIQETNTVERRQLEA